MKIRKGDQVKVISGKSRGKTSKILAVIPDKHKVIVEKVNIVKKHRKQTGNQKDPGGILEVEAPIDISNVMVICPSCNEPTRVGYKFVEKKKLRVCKNCKHVLD